MELSTLPTWAHGIQLIGCLAIIILLSTSLFMYYSDILKEARQNRNRKNDSKNKQCPCQKNQ